MALDQLLFQYATGEIIAPGMPEMRDRESTEPIGEQTAAPAAEPEAAVKPTFRSPPIYEDPRPDLTEDHELWNELLQIAFHFHPQMPEKSEEFCGVLNAFRAGGTRIRAGKNGWVLRPDIDETGRKAWSSQAEYDEMKEKFLVPLMEWLKFALKKLNEKVPFNRAF